MHVAVVTVAFFQATISVTSALIWEPLLFADTNVTADPVSFGSASSEKVHNKIAHFLAQSCVRHILIVTHRD